MLESRFDRRKEEEDEEEEGLFGIRPDGESCRKLEEREKVRNVIIIRMG